MDKPIHSHSYPQQHGQNSATGQAQAQPFHTYEEPLACGSSLTEALALNCTFDQLSTSWLPRSCPRGGNDAFISRGFEDIGQPTTGWPYYRDSSGQEPLSLTELSHLTNPGDKYWTTNGEHLAHCAFSFIRIAEALDSGSRTDWMVGKLGHNIHCAKIMLEAAMKSPGIDKIGSFAEVPLGTC